MIKKDSFSASFQQGQKGEKELDIFFSKFFKIHSANRSEEQAGIDRIFVPILGDRITVQYKTSYRQTRTAWLEIVAVRRQEQTVPGWVVTTQAQYVIFYESKYKTVYTIKTRLLRENIKKWSDTYPTVSRGSYKEGCTPWDSEGITVPFSVIQKLGTTIEIVT